MNIWPCVRCNWMEPDCTCPDRGPVDPAWADPDRLPRRDEVTERAVARLRVVKTTRRGAA